MPTEEKVLCFERQRLDDLGTFQGISLDVKKDLVPILNGPLTYLNRSEAENDRRYKQLIPYLLLVHEDTVLRYQRASSGQEGRLHGLYSIGVGGHISEEDCSIQSSDGGYRAAMWRELREEVAIEHVVSETPVAVINDDSTDVGAVHFGVVHIVRVKTKHIARAENSLGNPEFINIADAAMDYSRTLQEHGYETWSALCLASINAMLAIANQLTRTEKLNLCFNRSPSRGEVSLLIMTPDAAKYRHLTDVEWMRLGALILTSKTKDIEGIIDHNEMPYIPVPRETEEPTDDPCAECAPGTAPRAEPPAPGSPSR